MSLENTMSSARISMASEVLHYLEAMGSKVLDARFGFATPLLIVDEPPRLLRGAAIEINEMIDGQPSKAWVVSHNGCRIVWRSNTYQL